MSASRYVITGQVKDEKGMTLAGLLVEAFDDDLGSTDDYLGHAFTDSQGRFEIEFKEESFRGAYEILERNPDVYLVVTDKYGVVKKTETRSNAGDDDLQFGDIIIGDGRPFDDPYANSPQRMIALFASIGDTVDLSQAHPVRSSRQILRSITSWLHYTDPRVYKLYRYPGPQVIARPKEFPDHDHTIPWRED